MNQEVFLKGIEADPLDEGLRGVYADWLDEHDRPEEAQRQREWVKAFRHVVRVMADLSSGGALGSDKERREFWRCFRVVTGVEAPEHLRAQDWYRDAGDDYGCSC
jgi:uncharacterized protein (TIGR02996 family)